MKELFEGATLADALPADPDKVETLVARLETFVDGSLEASRRIRALDADGWIGEAANAFRSAIEELLNRLDAGATAFEEALFALRAYAATLRVAQFDARKAIELFDEGERTSRQWAQQGSPAQTLALDTVPASDDPGEPIRRAGRQLLVESREQVRLAAMRAADRLDEAAEYAPDKPGFWSRRWHNATEFAGGAFESTVGTATFAFKLSPAYALIQPERFAENAEALANGLAHGVTHPVEFTKAVLDWDTWAESPGRALGHLLPGVALAVATGGGGAAAEASAEMSTVGERAAVSSVAEIEANSTAPALRAAELTDRTPAELRQLAREKGFEAHGQPDGEGNFRKFRDPETKEPRLRIDQGHKDPQTGLPYNDPRAAVPHAHGYEPGGKPLVDPETGNKHFPLR